MSIAIKLPWPMGPKFEMDTVVSPQTIHIFPDERKIVCYITPYYPGTADRIPGQMAIVEMVGEDYDAFEQFASTFFFSKMAQAGTIESNGIKLDFTRAEVVDTSALKE